MAPNIHQRAAATATFVAVVGIFALTALVASLLPASEAARTNPIGVLRYD